MSREFPRDAGRALAGGEVVNGANVVKTTAGDVVPAGGVCTGHNP